ncbi:MAG: two-component regulator propeller domain-containing protein [Bacteroidota bacterium]
MQAQIPVFRPHSIQELGYSHLTTVFQDSSGWIWLGATNGLFRYDGLRYQSVQLPDKLHGHSVTALFEAQNRIWVGFDNGVIGFLPANTLFLPGINPAKTDAVEFVATLQIWQPEEGLPVKSITAFSDDGHGGFWFSTYGEGIYCAKNGHIYQFDSADDGLLNNDIYTMTLDGRGRVWAATDGGISICSMPEPGRKIIENLTVEQNGLPDAIITALATDITGNILIGTYERGVCRYNVAQQKIDYTTPNWDYGAVHVLATFGNDEIWAGTSNNGLIRIDSYTGNITPLDPKSPLAHAKINSMFKDREGLLWVISDKGFLSSGNMHFGWMETPFSDIQAICMDGRNRLWVGVKAGLFLRENNQFRRILPEKCNIISIWEAPNGQIWAGSFGDGVFLIDPSGHVFQHLKEGAALRNGSVLSISGDEHGVWLATLGGVFLAQRKSDGCVGTVSLQNELGSSYVYRVFRDHKGRTWFCTDGKGLFLLENQTFRSFQMADSIPLKTIYSIAEDPSGRLWFCTDRDGLFSYDGTKFEHYTEADHLHSRSIVGLATDISGKLIIAYEDGFDMLNTMRKNHVIFCDASLGAPVSETNLNALGTDARGHVWVGSSSGLVRIAAFREQFLDDPRPGLTSVSLFSKPFDFLHKKIFQHDENYFVFNFTGFWYTDPEIVRYRYKLEGFDPDWKISKDHLASYPNLRPGNYTFRLETTEHGNFEHVPQVLWTFSIRQPFWTRWWFELCYVLAIGGLIYAFVHTREQRMQREATLKREMVESQFATLKSQINPHFLFNSFNTLITIIEESPGLAVEYVEHLSDFYRSILVYREWDLISIEEELNLVRDFCFLLRKRYEDNFRMVIKVPTSAGQIMPLTLQILVENAVKHNIISTAHPLELEIFLEQGDYLVVRNNIQRKIKPELGTHFGLQSLIKRYQLLGERPVMVTDDGQKFTVKVPLYAKATGFVKSDG